jgi:hypothetical protein
VNLELLRTLGDRILLPRSKICICILFILGEKKTHAGNYERFKGGSHEIEMKIIVKMFFDPSFFQE